MMRKYSFLVWLSLLSALILQANCSSESKEDDPTPSEDPNPIEREVGVWPMSGTSDPDELASTYGPRILSGNYDFHRGFDVRAPTGTPVHAILAGTVVRVEEGVAGTSLERFGKFIVIAHPGVTGAAQRQTVYLHLDSFGVSEGDQVAMGEEIGKSGKSGVGINTEHLHFEYHIGVNDGKQSRLNTRSPMRILPYAKQEYTLTVAKSDQTLTVQITEDDASTDLVAFKFVPKGFSEKVIDFETRTGIDPANEDTNPFGGVTITPGTFVPSSESYELQFELSGAWETLSELSLELKDVQDSTQTFTFNF
ncbi:MAG: M23 family metallopeptidase [Reichenbachiella sp.]|uniref:M23 family metallopeptidase n=1 Tax=Reichenbachiella sp. TaxID=2184521 RepID=UPI0032661CDE